MTRPCPGPTPAARPKLKVPPRACDTHVHVIGPYSKFPMIEDRTYTAPEAPVEILRQFLDTLGIERVVIVHVTVAGRDPSVTLDALEHLGDRARGIAIIDPEISDGELDRLHERGIRGVGLTPLFGQEVGIELIKRVAARIERLGWHLLFMPSGPKQWLDLAPNLGDLPVDVVIDHMAWRGFKITDGIGQRGFQVLLELASTGRVWVKLAAPYRFSKVGPPSFSDVTPYVQALIEARPDRLLWATDWPHVRVWDRPMPNDADLLDWILDWGIDDATQHAILVDNPARLYGFDN